MPTITTSSRTASSVVLNGSGFLPELLNCSPLAVIIYDEQNNVLAASYEGAGNVLFGGSWQLTLTGLTESGLFARYVIDAEDNPGCYELNFYIAPFAVPENTIKRKTTIVSLSRSGSSLKLRSPSRRSFPSV